MTILTNAEVNHRKFSTLHKILRVGPSKGSLVIDVKVDVFWHKNLGVKSSSAINAKEGALQTAIRHQMKFINNAGVHCHRKFTTLHKILGVGLLNTKVDALQVVKRRQMKFLKI